MVEKRCATLCANNNYEIVGVLNRLRIGIEIYMRFSKVDCHPVYPVLMEHEFSLRNIGLWYAFSRIGVWAQTRLLRERRRRLSRVRSASAWSTKVRTHESNSLLVFAKLSRNQRLRNNFVYYHQSREIYEVFRILRIYSRITMREKKG